MKPREINPECIDDDAWWDLEALKLAVIMPEQFAAYANDKSTDKFTFHLGSHGLAALDLLDAEYDKLHEAVFLLRPFNQARVANFGDLLVAACQRVSKQCK